MSVQKGTGLVWSLPGFSLSGTGVYGAGIVQSVAYSRGGERSDVKGADGVTVTKVFFDGKETLTVEVIPSGTTIAAAKGNAILPARGADVTVDDSDDTEQVITGSGSGDGTGTYIFIEGSINKRVDGHVTLSMTLERGEKHLATVAAS